MDDTKQKSSPSKKQAAAIKEPEKKQNPFDSKVKNAFDDDFDDDDLDFGKDLKKGGVSGSQKQEQPQLGELLNAQRELKKEPQQHTIHNKKRENEDNGLLVDDDFGDDFDEEEEEEHAVEQQKPAATTKPHDIFENPVTSPTNAKQEQVAKPAEAEKPTATPATEAPE